MSLNYWEESELEKRVSVVTRKADVDIAAVNAKASEKINDSTRKYANEKKQNQKDSKFSISSGGALFPLFFIIGGCYGVYSYMTGSSPRMGIVGDIFLIPIMFVIVGLIAGGIGFVIGLIYKAMTSRRNAALNSKNDQKYYTLTREAEDSATKARDEEIRKIEEKRDREIRNITEAYNGNVKEAYDRLINSPYNEKIVNLLYEVVLQGVSSANKAPYIKNLDMAVWFHVYFDRIDACVEEFVERGPDSKKESHILTQREFVLKQQMLRNLESDEQCDALTEAAIKQLKEKVYENDEFASVDSKRRGAQGRLGYKTPNPDVKQFIGF